jgi:hypothetical protein
VRKLSEETIQVSQKDHDLLIGKFYKAHQQKAVKITAQYLSIETNIDLTIVKQFLSDQERKGLIEKKDGSYKLAITYG